MQPTLAMRHEQMGTGWDFQKSHCPADKGQMRGQAFGLPLSPSSCWNEDERLEVGQPHAQDSSTQKTEEAGHCATSPRTAILRLPGM